MKIRIDGMSGENVERLVTKWSPIGTMGAPIVRLLRSFYSPRISFALRPPARELHAVCQKAFGRFLGKDRFEGVRVVTPHDFARDFRNIVRTELPHFMPSCAQLVPKNDEHWPTITHAKKLLHKTLQDVLRQRLRDTFGAQQWSRAGGRSALAPVLLSDFLHRGLLFLMEQTVGFRVVRRHQFLPPGFWMLYRPALSLWLTGNLPLGLNERYALAKKGIVSKSGRPASVVVLCSAPL